MKFLRWRSLSLQIILAILLPLTLAAIILSFYSQDLHHTAMQHMVAERNLRTVQVLAQAVDGRILAGDPAERAFTELAGPLAQPGLVSVQIYNSDHALVYETGRSPLANHLAYHDSVLAGLDGGSGVAFPDGGHTHGDGSHVIAYAPIPSTGWVLVMDEAWQDVSSTELDATQTAPLILIPFIVLAFAVLILILRQVVMPLQRLEKQTQALGAGDFSALDAPVGGIDEIRSLQQRMAAMADNLRQARQNLKGYIGSITRGVEEERMRIARELHDQPLQSLIALKHQSQTGSRGDVQPQVLQGVIDDLRALVRGLRPVMLEDLGLTAALESLAAIAQKDSHLPVSFTSQGQEYRLPADVELAFFRVAQEGLMNVQKHAGATRADLKLVYSAEVLDMTLSDDGSGFIVPERVDTLAADGHFGLVGILERAALIGADASIHSAPGEGTTLTLRYQLRNHSGVDGV